jgi:hypothetical protein
MDFPDYEVDEANMPTEVREWLQKRGERVSEWRWYEERWKRGRFGRPGICMETDFAPQRFIVTPHSFTSYASQGDNASTTDPT